MRFGVHEFMRMVERSVSATLIVSIPFVFANPARASDYSDGLAAVDRATYAVARAAFLRSAERGHVKSQVALGLLASGNTDRPPRFDEALGWFLAAQENGDSELGDRIDRARASLGSASDAEAQRIVAAYGRAAMEASWVWGPANPDYKTCGSSTASTEPGKSAAPLVLQHSAIGVVQRTAAGRLMDVQMAFRYPEGTKRISEDFFVRRMMSNPASIAAKRCGGSDTLIVTALATKSDKFPEFEQTYDKAGKGDPGAQFIVGMMQSASDRGASTDRGLALIEEAAQGGEPRAQHFMWSHIGNNALGRKWLELAAAGGVAFAQVDLAEQLIASSDRTASLSRIDELLRGASSTSDQYVLARVAAVRAAAPDEMLRDVNSAPAMAKQLDPKAWPVPIRLEAAALAYAATGDFKAAIKLEKQAISVAKRLEYDLTHMNERLDAYAAGRAWVGYLTLEYR